jgi:anti-sigma regulatory factor (Ser/Thr protein kinase)
MVEIAPFIPDDAPQHIAFVHQSWPAYSSELAPIRSEVHRWLAPLRLTANTEDDIVYAVNEAATNAVEHAYPPGTVGDTVELTFWTEATALCIDIVDHGKWQTPTSPDLTGRGLGIPVMQQLIDSVLIHYDNTGTEVFLRHPLHPASP